jgi:CBS domain containing-hemolysin-like protein
MALLVAQPMYIITIIMYPVTALTGAISRGILRLGGVRAHKDEVTEEEIMAALSLGAEAGAIDRDEEEMMQNVIEFGESMVKEAMLPLRKVVSIKDSCNLMDVITLMLETKFSRLPVCHGRPDNIVGVINLRGILKYIKKQRFDVRVSDVMEPVVSVSEYLMLDEAFEKMRERSAHIAVVKDIKRHVVGIITMEDLLEEIVGEIYDESDRKRVRVKFMDSKTAIVNGETLVTELQKKIGVPLKSRYPTISDLVSARMDGRPKAGRSIKMKNFILTVMAVDSEDHSKIKRLRIVKRRGKIRR